MNRKHAVILFLAIGLTAIIGVFAATRTVGLGHRTRAATDAQVAQRTAALDRYAASLRKVLAQKPRELPALPASSTATGLTGEVQPVRVVYHRPPPIVIHTHRSGQGDYAEGGEADD